MLTLYLVCLIIGGALVAVSIFAGGDVDVDADLSADVDIEAEADVEGAVGEGVAAAARFLSLRNAVFFVTFFGLTGTLLTSLGIGFVLTLISALTIGSVAAFSIYRLMEFLRTSETGVLPASGALEGAMAAVVVDFDDTRSGKVSVTDGGQTVQLIARVHEQAETRRFGVGDEVVIVDLQDGIAHVAGTRFLA